MQINDDYYFVTRLSLEPFKSNSIISYFNLSKRKVKRKTLHLDTKKDNSICLKCISQGYFLCTRESVKLCTSAATLHTDVSDMVIKWEAISFNNDKKETSVGAYYM